MNQKYFLDCLKERKDYSQNKMLQNMHFANNYKYNKFHLKM